MEGRLILIQLICKDTVDERTPDNNIFTSCVSFRVAGTPSKDKLLYPLLQRLRLLSKRLNYGDLKSVPTINKWVSQGVQRKRLP